MEPRNLNEQLAMEAAKSDPAGGYVIMENLKDPRIPSSFVAYRLHNWSGAT